MPLARLVLRGAHDSSRLSGKPGHRLPAAASSRTRASILCLASPGDGGTVDRLQRSHRGAISHADPPGRWLVARSRLDRAARISELARAAGGEPARARPLPTLLRPRCPRLEGRPDDDRSDPGRWSPDRLPRRGANALAPVAGGSLCSSTDPRSATTAWPRCCPSSCGSRCGWADGPLGTFSASGRRFAAAGVGTAAVGGRLRDQHPAAAPRCGGDAH